MLHAVANAALQQHGQPGDVTRNILPGRLNRIAHTGLRSEMYDLPKFMRPEQSLHPALIRQVQFAKRKPVMLPQPVKAGCLQRRVIIRIQVVQSDNLAAVVQQRLRDRATDKTGRSGNQNRCFGLLQLLLNGGFGSLAR